MQYAGNCLRGIPKLNQIADDGQPFSEVFFFQQKHVREKDDLIAESINWEDDGGAIAFSLSMRYGVGEKEGKVQFEGGVAILPRSDLDTLAKLQFVSQAFSYEQDKQDGNPYHGNLLLHKDFPRHSMVRFAAMLATCVARIEPQPSEVAG